MRDDHAHGAGALPRGVLVRYREWYGAHERTGAGLRLDAETVADGIVEREAGENVGYGVADPATFARDGGPSLAERMGLRGVHFRRGDNTRVGEVGALAGWEQVRADRRRGRAADALRVRDLPRLHPHRAGAAARSPQRPEDLDTRGEDHIADETRYACLSRPMTLAPLPASPALPPRQRGEKACASALLSLRGMTGDG